MLTDNEIKVLDAVEDGTAVSDFMIGAKLDIDDGEAEILARNMHYKGLLRKLAFGWNGHHIYVKGDKSEY